MFCQAIAFENQAGRLALFIFDAQEENVTVLWKLTIGAVEDC